MKRCAVPLLLVLVASAVPALADEVVYFTNGTTMAIRSHEVDKDMIRVNFGAGAVMAFPIAMVERVQLGSRDVFTGPAYRPSNQAVPGAEGSSAQTVEVSRDNTITAEGNLPARYRMNGGESTARAGGDDSFTAPGSAGQSGRRGPAARLRRPNDRAAGLTRAPEGSVLMGDQYMLSSRSPEATPNKPEILTFGPRSGPDAGAPPNNEGGAQATPEATPEPPPESD